jgi:rod shape-determining protein MreC
MSNFFKKTFIYFLVIFLLIFLIRFGFFNFFANFLEKIFIALNNKSIDLVYFFKPLFLKKEILKNYKDLEKKLLEIQLENISLKIEAQENLILRKKLNFLNQFKYKYVLANVIGQRAEPGFNFYIIDKGRKDNVKEGAPVIVNEGYLIGKILKVEEERSYFVSILDPHFLTSVDFISNNLKVDTISGLARGKYNLIEIEMIPNEKEVNIGDFVITSGLETGIPRGLIVGKVESVEKRINEQFQKAVVKPLISLSNVRIVALLSF